ncbi:MAG: GNAT family N-acetyltransferase [Pseudomonadota bacterium]|nr:GNAT family N-acetyltransferase [Pseudomonadota bacterium]
MPAAVAVTPLDAIVPVLETPRLRLRAHRVEDFQPLADMWADPQVYRHLSARASTREESWLRLLRYAGLWNFLGYGCWAVEERSTGRCIGDLGYADFKRGIPALEGVPEMCWVLAAQAHGKGYASEALTAAMAWGQTHFGDHHCACIISPDNAGSIKVATKAGFRPAGQTIYRDEPILWFIR